MSFRDRLSRLAKSYAITYYNRSLKLINELAKPINKLTKPMLPSDFVDEEEVKEVLTRGMSRRDEYSAIYHYLRHAKNYKDFRDRNFSVSDLLEVCSTMGVPREFVKHDLMNVKRRHNRRKTLRENLKAFIIFQFFAVAVGMLLGGSIAGIKIVATAWSIAILVQYLNIREAEASETERLFQHWIDLERTC